MHESRWRGGTALAVTAFALLFWGPGRARADLTLTPAAQGQGFSLTTFATGFPTDSGVPATGPYGFAFTAGGGVLVSDYPGDIRFFPAGATAQSAGAMAVMQNAGVNNAVGMAQVGSSIYMTQENRGAVVQVNPGGTLTPIVDIPSAAGIISNPTNGHLFVDSRSATPTIFDVNPITGTKTVFASALVDGLAITADGKTLYAAADGLNAILGYDTATKALVFNSGPIDSGPGGHVDGIALGTGILDGNLFVNTTGGTLVEVNLATLTQTTIAAGGSRGDFVTAAPDGSLLLTQSDSVLRLTAPAGGGFLPQGTPPNLPEPSSFALLGLGAAALAGWRWRRGRGPARPQKKAD